MFLLNYEWIRFEIIDCNMLEYDVIRRKMTNTHDKTQL